MSTDYEASEIGSGQMAQTALNEELAEIQLALERTLNLHGDDGQGSNALELDIDMNGNTLLNLATPSNPNDPVRLQDIQALTTPVSVGTAAAINVTITDGGDKFTSGNVEGALQELAGLRTDLASNTSGKGSDLVAVPKVYSPEYLKVTSDLLADIPVSMFRFYPTNITRSSIRAGTNIVNLAPYINAAIQAAQGSTLILPRGVHALEEQIVITAACKFTGDGVPGPRVYANPATVYGGAELVFTKSVSSSTDPGSFAVALDIGAINAEGNSQVEFENIGISWTDVNAGGIYVEGASGPRIKNLWLTGGIIASEADTLTGIAIYARDMISGLIDGINLYAVAYGIVADDIFNQNTIIHCNGQRITKKGICLFAVRPDAENPTASIRNTIAECNLIGGLGNIRMDNAIHLAGDVLRTSIIGCTMEVTGEHPILIDDKHPLTGATLPASPYGVDIQRNGFLACGIAVDPSFCIQISSGSHISIDKNSVRNAAETMAAFVNISASTSNIFLGPDNQLEDIPLLYSGNPPTISDSSTFRQMPWDTSETEKATWTSDDQGKVWFNNADTGSYQNSLRYWNGTRPCNILDGGARTDTTSDTTPDVSGLSTLSVNPSGTYTITALDNGTIGRTVTIYNLSAHNVTIACTGTNLKRAAGTDVVLAQNQWYTFKNLDGTTWIGW